MWDLNNYREIHIGDMGRGREKLKHCPGMMDGHGDFTWKYEWGRACRTCAQQHNIALTKVLNPTDTSE